MLRTPSISANSFWVRSCRLRHSINSFPVMVNLIYQWYIFVKYEDWSVILAIVICGCLPSGWLVQVDPVDQPGKSLGYSGKGWGILLGGWVAKTKNRGFGVPPPYFTFSLRGKIEIFVRKFLNGTPNTSTKCPIWKAFGN